LRTLIIFAGGIPLQSGTRIGASATSGGTVENQEVAEAGVAADGKRVTNQKEIRLQDNEGREENSKTFSGAPVKLR